MIGEQIQCERAECGKTFTKRTHNQKYCEDECTRLATNVNLRKKYYERRAQRLGHARYCVVCTATRLSRYNPDTVCNSCTQRLEMERNQSVGNSLMSVEWVF